MSLIDEGFCCGCVNEPYLADEIEIDDGGMEVWQDPMAKGETKMSAKEVRHMKSHIGRVPCFEVVSHLLFCVFSPVSLNLLLCLLCVYLIL